MGTQQQCRRCGKPCDEKSFFTLPSGRVWMHMACMMAAGKEAIESGRADDVRIAIKWPDGVTEITSGKNLRDPAAE
jgi:hypothetical protein